MNIKLIAAAGFAFMLPLSAAHAQKTVTTKRGGTASSSVVQKGNSVAAVGTATSSRGNTVSGVATATKTKTGTVDSATVTGPKGGTTSATGTTTNNGTSTTANGTVTGPQGKSKSGTVTVPKSGQRRSPNKLAGLRARAALRAALFWCNGRPGTLPRSIYPYLILKELGVLYISFFLHHFRGTHFY